MEDSSKEIKGVIKDIFQSKKRFARGYNQYSIEQIWRDTFGELISNYTTKVYFSNGKLTIYINSASLKNEIMLNKQSVIERLNKVLKYNKVSELYVK